MQLPPIGEEFINFKTENSKVNLTKMSGEIFKNLHGNKNSENTLPIDFSSKPHIKKYKFLKNRGRSLSSLEPLTNPNSDINVTLLQIKNLEKNYISQQNIEIAKPQSL